MSSAESPSASVQRWRNWTLAFVIGGPLFVVADGVFQLAHPMTRNQWIPNRLMTLVLSVVACGLLSFGAFLILKFRASAIMRRPWNQPITTAAAFTIQGATFLANGIASIVLGNTGGQPLLVLAAGELIMAIVAFGGYYLEGRHQG